GLPAFRVVAGDHGAEGRRRVVLRYWIRAIRRCIRQQCTILWLPYFRWNRWLSVHSGATDASRTWLDSHADRPHGRVRSAIETPPHDALECHAGTAIGLRANT